MNTTACVLEHALHEKTLSRQLGGSTLASNTKRRALVVSPVNRDFVSPSLYIRIRLFVFPETRPGECRLMVWQLKKTSVFRTNRLVGVPFCRPRPASPPRRVSLRPDTFIICSGFRSNKFGLDNCGLYFAFVEGDGDLRFDLGFEKFRVSSAH